MKGRLSDVGRDEKWNTWQQLKPSCGPEPRGCLPWTGSQYFKKCEMDLESEMPICSELEMFFFFSESLVLGTDHTNSTG